ncbi:VOC family protein [Planctomycetes bacterium K23_9]|uniref:27 kDa antigen Cfp30B n=1 Tax=Stieleria marina TaxID=1930275 RepID=A0A517NRX6_9BACT|nr:27 kDa antigen Cfp30B [Planctomycetes bacterium K23_9]
MTDQPNPPGNISWVDLTVGGESNAEEVRDFYQQVVGWTHEPVDMGDYQDFCMQSSDGQVVAGICHAQGANADLPTTWLVYITVADIQASIAKCQASGGQVVKPIAKVGGGQFAVLKDPAGAVFAVYQAVS